VELKKINALKKKKEKEKMIMMMIDDIEKKYKRKEACCIYFLYKGSRPDMSDRNMTMLQDKKERDT